MALDEKGAAGMPTRLIISVILFGALIALASSALVDFMDGSERASAHAEVSKIISAAELMYSGGGARDVRIVGGMSISVQRLEVDIPGGVRYVVLGSMPSGSSEPRTRDLRTANNYYYVMDDGYVVSGASRANFAGCGDGGFDPQKPAVLHAGSHELTLELVTDGSGAYVMVCA